VGRGGVVPSSLILLLDGGEWSASCPGHFKMGKETPVLIG
jgi:hypothetical protein